MHWQLRKCICAGLGFATDSTGFYFHLKWKNKNILENPLCRKTTLLLFAMLIFSTLMVPKNIKQSWQCIETLPPEPEYTFTSGKGMSSASSSKSEVIGWDYWRCICSQAMLLTASIKLARYAALRYRSPLDYGNHRRTHFNICTNVSFIHIVYLFRLTTVKEAQVK